MSEDRVAPEFELDNAGGGPDPCSLAALAREYDFAVLFVQVEWDSTHCRRQVVQVRKRRESFTARGAVPVVVLPEVYEAAESWQDDYDLPFPLLSDPDAAVASDYGQPDRLGFLGDWLGFLGDLLPFLGRQPTVAVVDLRASDPRIVWTDTGRTTHDRPQTREILDAVDERADAGEGGR